MAGYMGFSVVYLVQAFTNRAMSMESYIFLTALKTTLKDIPVRLTWSSCE